MSTINVVLISLIIIIMGILLLLLTIICLWHLVEYIIYKSIWRDKKVLPYECEINTTVDNIMV
jgi:hypothetical protein